MTYKHGDWYCKPANEAEAKEIIERAVASGARNIHGWQGNSTRNPYGVINGRVDFGVLDGTEYTIEQVREKFPLPGEQQQWNGEGLPPVGVDCQMRFDGDWIQAKIIGFDKNHPIVKMHIKRDGFTEIVYRACYMCTFRPLRSERERWVESAERLIEGKYGCPANYQHVSAIYDAIKSGHLKAPVVE